MKKLVGVLFCVLVLTIGVAAGNNKNCMKFDEDIKAAFSNYGPIGVDVKLLSVNGRPISIEPGYCCEVMLRVQPVVKDPKATADTWHFCGGLIYKTSGPVPVGIRVIDKDKLIGCCMAAKIVLKKDPKFPVDKATVNLYWVLYPGCIEPYYYFIFGDKYYSVGAYTGKLYE